MIYLITSGTASAVNYLKNSRDILATVQSAVQAKINIIQIREKKLPAKLLYQLAVEAAAITRGSETKLLVNDRVDIALAAQADGVHLTSVSLNSQVVRKISPPNFIVAVSAHSLSDAENAVAQEANFVTFSPVFQTPSKSVYGKPQGLNNLRVVCEKLKPFPVIALGGIDETNITQVLENGASGYAAIRFLNDKLKNGNLLHLPESQV